MKMVRADVGMRGHAARDARCELCRDSCTQTCAPPSEMQTTHAAAGVEKGLSSASGMPIEVMGLLVGHIDTETPGSIIVTDVREGGSTAC